MTNFLNIYIFHWVPEKAIYISGQSLPWDARCAGIYTGFGIGLIYLLLTGRKDRNLPRLSILIINTFMFIPIFIDLLTIWISMREPSNDIRYLTGILFGGALSIYLYPAFISLAFSDNQNSTSINSFTKYGIFLFLSTTAFFVKVIDSIVVFIILTSLSVLGFGGLIVILSIGIIKGVNGLRKYVMNWEFNHKFNKGGER